MNRGSPALPFPRRLTPWREILTRLTGSARRLTARVNLDAPALLESLEPHALAGLAVRPRCWIRGQHRWRVPDHALLAECRDLAVTVRCAHCGCQRTMRGGVIQHAPTTKPVDAAGPSRRSEGSEPMQPAVRPRASMRPDLKLSVVYGELLQVARRQGYEDGLVAVGVPYRDAVRRATERYP
jgi:hypothetical protein